jgi:hypothetical protein
MAIPGSGTPAFRNPGIGKQARYYNPLYTYSECGFIVSGLHSTNIEITCGEYIEILYGSYIIPHESDVRPKWVNDLSPICDLYIGSMFPTHISHQPHIGNTYPPCIKFLYGMNFSCLVGTSQPIGRSPLLFIFLKPVMTRTTRFLTAHSVN